MKTWIDDKSSWIGEPLPAAFLNLKMNLKQAYESGLCTMISCAFIGDKFKELKIDQL